MISKGEITDDLGKVVGECALSRLVGEATVSVQPV